MFAGRGRPSAARHRRCALARVRWTLGLPWRVGAFLRTGLLGVFDPGRPSHQRCLRRVLARLNRPRLHAFVEAAARASRGRQARTRACSGDCRTTISAITVLAPWRGRQGIGQSEYDGPGAHADPTLANCARARPVEMERGCGGGGCGDEPNDTVNDTRPTTGGSETSTSGSTTTTTGSTATTASTGASSSGDEGSTSASSTSSSTGGTSASTG